MKFLYVVILFKKRRSCVRYDFLLLLKETTANFGFLPVLVAHVLLVRVGVQAAHSRQNARRELHTISLS
jgi:hypothetical protein